MLVVAGLLSLHLLPPLASAPPQLTRNDSLRRSSDIATAGLTPSIAIYASAVDEASPHPDSTPAPPLPMAGEESLRKVAGYVVEIPSDVLDTLQHDSSELSPAEVTARDRFLDRVRVTPLNVLERAAASEFSHADLERDPRRYSGRITSLEGTVLRCQPLEFRRADGTSQTVYAAWLITDRGGRDHPYRIVCDTLPERFPIGDSLNIAVEVTGYFFKRQCDATEREPTVRESTVVPVLIAKRFRWSTPTAGGLDEGTTWAGRIIATLLALMAAGFGIVAWRLTRYEHIRARSRRTPRSRLSAPQQIDPESPPAAPLVEDFLRNLERKP